MGKYIYTNAKVSIKTEQNRKVDNDKMINNIWEERKLKKIGIRYVFITFYPSGFDRMVVSIYICVSM